MIFIIIAIFNFDIEIQTVWKASKLIFLLIMILRVVDKFRIADAEENLGESEVREAHLAKSLFFIRIGDKVYTYPNLFFFS